MKRICASALALLCLLLLLCPLVLADGEDDVFVYDLASLLTEEQRQEMEEYAGSISRTYDCGVYIVTLEDYSRYGGSTYEAAVDIFLDNGFGLGEEQSGVLLLLSMAERDYSLIAHGYGNVAFTDYGKNALSRTFLDNFADNDWAGGFADYLRGSEELLRQAAAGTAYDVPQYDDGYESGGVVESRDIGAGSKLGICAAIGSAISGLACTVMKSRMRSVGKAVTAEEYVLPGGLELLESSDILTHVSERRVRVGGERQSSSSGGTSIDSSGFSSQSGKF